MSLVAMRMYLIPAEILEIVEKLLERFGIVEVGSIVGPFLKGNNLIVERNYKIINPFGTINKEEILKRIEERLKMIDLNIRWELLAKQINDKILNLRFILVI